MSWKLVRSCDWKLSQRPLFAQRAIAPSALHRCEEVGCQARVILTVTGGVAPFLDEKNLSGNEKSLSRNEKSLSRIGKSLSGSARSVFNLDIHLYNLERTFLKVLSSKNNVQIRNLILVFVVGFGYTFGRVFRMFFNAWYAGVKTTQAADEKSLSENEKSLSEK